MLKLAIGLIALFGTGGLLAADASEQIRERVEWLMFETGLSIDGEPILARDLLAELYAENEYEPLWPDRESIDRLPVLVEFAWQQGLDPDDYPLQALGNLLPPVGLPEDPRERAELDILATEALIRVAYQIRFGKVNPYQLFADWNFDRELLPGLNPVEVLIEFIHSDDLIAGVNEAIERGPIYRATVGALADHRVIEAQGGWPAVPDGPTLRAGQRDARVAALRARLIVSGEASASAEAELFDDDLAEAVEVFQLRHGLDADGVVGRQTLAALNVGVAERILQIRATLERARWVFEDIQSLGDRLVLVNIASAEVNLFQGEEIVWNTRAQIGKPYRQTPVFKDEIEYLVFNPTWTVPPTILRNDVLPRLKADPAGYLAQKNMDLLNRDGEVVAVDDVDWESVGAGRFPYIVRQRPGPWNVLGMVKFIFPNPHFVFLHDTPSRELFKRADRAFSSGCVRVEDPFVFAELLFDEPETWNQSAFQQILDSSQIRTVHLKKPVPVFLMYLTAEVDGEGGIRFFEDIYGRDQSLLDALDAPPEYGAFDAPSITPGA
jgi:murein L,D-transpeptidase YcbB/YkuD